VLERTIDVPRNLVWAAWTKPEHVSKWFTPAPWTVTDCKIERSREGKEFPNIGCDLEIIPNERLVWTDALLAGYRLGAASSIRHVSLDNVPNAGVYRFGPVAEG
jgi:Activator of Hsp90 ATPase homolog 1-like protein